MPLTGSAARRILRPLMFLGVLGLLLLILAENRVVDGDVFHQMALVREAIAQGRFPRGDCFAYTPTLDIVVHHEWGTGAILYALWEGTGWGAAGLSGLRYALVLTVLAIAYGVARRRGASDAAVALVAPLALPLLAIGFLSPVRAQAWTLCFTALLLLALEADGAGKRWWIPWWLLLHLVWLNLHGGFVIGFAVVLTAAVERFSLRWAEGMGARSALRSVAHLAPVLCAMTLLWLANPYGRDYVTGLLRSLQLPRPEVPEWGPLWDGRVSRVWIFLYVASLLILFYAARRAGLRGIAQGCGLVFAAVAAIAAAASVRHMSIYAVAWFTTVAPLVTRTDLGRMAERVWERRPFPVAIVFLLFVLNGTWQTFRERAWTLTIPDGRGTEYRTYPVGPADFLAGNGFRGNLLTDFLDGAYVSWRLHPAVKVSMDSRYEVAYRPGIFEEHQAFFAGKPGWEKLPDRYPTDAMLVPRRSPVDPLIEGALATREVGRWVLVYRDDGYSLYVKAPTAADLPSGARVTGAASPRR